MNNDKYSDDFKKTALRLVEALFGDSLPGSYADELSDELLRDEDVTLLPKNE